jgi:SPP1 gp7 family putative phage head morphogenesis protein
LTQYLTGLGPSFADTRNKLATLYAGCGHEACEGHKLSGPESENWAEQLAPLLAAEVQRVWNARQMPTLNEALTIAYTNIFETGIAKGFGVNINEIDYNSPDAAVIANLRENAYQFSAAKNYTQLKHLTQALVDGDGKLRSWSAFKKAAFEINNEHVTSWLKAEYDTAIGSAQMASLWQRIEAEKDTLPLLQFDAVIDKQTSDICRPLEGVIKPVGDPFWDTYYPPNHFRCRSTVRQLPSGVVTPDNRIVTPEKVPALFKTNLAKTGLLFPANHPYFIDKPENVESVYVAPATTPAEELTQTVFALAKDNPDWFHNGFKKISPTTKYGSNGFTDMVGNISIKDDRLKLCNEGIRKIKAGQAANFDEEDALSTLWHEIWHNRHQLTLPRINRTQRLFMELSNELMSRNTLPQFFEALGGKLSNTQLMSNRESTGYNSMVRNYEKAIEWCGADKEKVLEQVQKHLLTKSYTTQKTGLVNALKKHMAYDIPEISSIVEDCTLYNESFFEKRLDQRKKTTR